VDLDPQAAEIAVVNLMMRAMEALRINAAKKDKRLPLILNQNVKVGNSLIGLRADDPRMAEHREQIALLIRLRSELITKPHNTPEHKRIIGDLRLETHRLHNELTTDIYAHFGEGTHETVRPFCWGVEFPEVFFDAEGNPLENPGFTIIIGNPPWEILKPDLREFYAQYDPEIESRLNRQQVETRIAQLEAEDPRRRDAYNVNVKLTEQTAAFVRKSGDYVRQGRGDLATHKLFIERMYGLLRAGGEEPALTPSPSPAGEGRREGGRLGYVVPSGIYTESGHERTA
jgi:hypothetical protein